MPSLLRLSADFYFRFAPHNSFLLLPLSPPLFSAASPPRRRQASVAKPEEKTGIVWPACLTMLSSERAANFAKHLKMKPWGDKTKCEEEKGRGRDREGKIGHIFTIFIRFMFASTFVSSSE